MNRQNHEAIAAIIKKVRTSIRQHQTGIDIDHINPNILASLLADYMAEDNSESQCECAFEAERTCWCIRDFKRDVFIQDCH